jgi:hypothetical protein
MRDDVFGKRLIVDQENGTAAGIVLGHCNCGKCEKKRTRIAKWEVFILHPRIIVAGYL